MVLCPGLGVSCSETMSFCLENMAERCQGLEESHARLCFCMASQKASGDVSQSASGAGLVEPGMLVAGDSAPSLEFMHRTPSCSVKGGCCSGDGEGLPHAT